MSTRKKEPASRRTPVEIACANIMEAFEDETSELGTDDVSEVLEAVASELEDRLEAIENDNLLEEIDTEDWELMDEVDLVDFDDHDGQ